jgi:hypothetical protein
LKYEQTPLAHITGDAAIDLSQLDINAIRKFVEDGGVLLVEPFGGSSAFLDFAERSLLPRIAPGTTPTELPRDHPLLLGEGEAMSDLRYLPVREAAKDMNPNFRIAKIGKGTILLSRLDLTTGLLGAHTAGVLGYQPEGSERFIQNLIFWSLSEIRDRE